MDKKNIEDIVALTPMQEGMLFHYLEDPDNDRYFEQLSLNISGPIDIERFQQAWKFVIKSNEMLRTCFVWKKVKNPVQVVAKESTLDFRYYDIGKSPGSKNINRLTLEDIKIKDREEKFKLEEVPFRVTLCRIGECRYEMIVSNHHILYDGWSNGIILEEFFAAYNGLSRGNKCLPSPLKTTFREFVAWIKNRDKNKQENYWKNYLTGANSKIELPVKSGKVEFMGIRRAENFQVRFPPGLDGQLEHFVSLRKITLASLFYSAWGILLQRYNGVDDAVFGTTVSGRSAKIKDIENIVGLFINTLPLRIQTAPGEKIGQLLLETNETLQTREEYETTSLVDIKEYCRPGNDGALFNTIVVIGNYPLDNLAGEDSVLSVNGYSLFEMTNYDLTVGITTAGGIQIDFLYNKDLFEKETIERLSGHFSAIVGETLYHPGKKVGRIEMLSEEEKNKLLVDFNDTAAGYPRDQLIHRLFEEQVDKTPDSTAVVFENNHLTYKELDERANRLAQLLRLKGVKPDTIVGLIGDFSLEMPVGIMGIFKSDGAFLPIRSDYPAHRVEYMLEDSNTRLLVTQVDVRTGSRSFRFDGEIIEIYDEAFYTRNTRSERPVSAAASENLAYLMYTSGSTGKPKGVLVEHRSVINLVYWFGKTYNLQPGVRVVQLSDYTFDPIDEEIFATWLYGGTLHVVPRELLTHVQRLRRYIQEKQVHMVNCVPTFLKELLAHDRKLECIRLVISGGDRLDNATKDMLVDRGYVVYNHYGLIETTLDVLTSLCLKERWASLVRPMANAGAYILDKDNRLLPIGAAGELCIAGDAVVRGYSNKPELDMQRFPGSPFHRGESMLRTGDLARVLADGNIEILGRIDDQVKVRGFRIELGEIASQLLNHPGVKDAAVITRGNQEKRQVYAYYVDEARHKPELFPSVGEYPLYDDFLYYAMTNDERRNKSYRAAINRLVKDKTAVEIGTGQDAVLARFCLEAGAKKIYAVEMSRKSYEIAGETVQKLGLEDKIILVHGDATVVELPEKVDICISEIIGNIGGSEGAAAILKNARRFLKEDGLMIPGKCITKIAAVHLPEVLREKPGFSEVGAGYIKTLFDYFGYKFDFRIGVKRFPTSHIISNAGIFEQLDFNFIAVEAAHEIHLVMDRDTILDGFLLWINLHTVEDEIIDTLAQEYNWMPVFVPLVSGGIRVSRGDVIKAECSRKLSRNGINPDYTVKGILTGESRSPIAFECHLPYYEKRFSGTPFHRKILDDTGVYARYINRETGAAELLSCLESKLPAYMIPSYFMKVDRIPLTPNGKVDTKALPVPGVSEAYEPPRDNLEKKLVELWLDVLGVETVGITDNFFTLGGHSLKATILVSRIGKAFDVEFPLNVVYSRPTVKEFARFIRTARRSIFESIQQVEEREYYPLSSAQKRIFLLEQFENIGTSYNGFSAHKCLGKLDKERFQDILTRLVQRHESLRTSYHFIDNQPVQRIHDNVVFEIECRDELEEFVRPFDLTGAPLIRVGVITLSEGEHLLLFDIHHIASDGTSNAVLVDEFVRLYRGDPVLPLRIRYKDFARWQNRSFALPEMKQQEAFWLDVFSSPGEIPVLNLPCDYARPEVQGFAGSRISFAIGKEETGALKAFALREDATLYMVLLAIYNVLLSKISGQGDIVVGSPIAGRRHVDLEPVVGMFVNTLAMRNYPSGEKPFNRFLAEVGERTRKAFENQDYPFETLVEKAAGKIKRDTGRNPLFDVMLVLQNIDIEEVDAAGMKLLPYEYEHRTAKFDLNLEAVDNGDTLTFNLEYSTSLFKTETIGKFTGYFRKVLQAVLEDPDIRIGRIEIMDEQEKRAVLNFSRGIREEVDLDATIHRLFEAKLERRPDSAAVVSQSAAHNRGVGTRFIASVTYRELNERANQLARVLRSKGVGTDKIVGLMVERTVEMVIGMLAILKAGGAYLPIDPEYPEGRIRYMLHGCAVSLLLTNCDPECISRYISRDLEAIDIRDKNFYTGNSGNLPGKGRGSDLVYVLYTSGSTGKPKGLMLEHINLVNLIRHHHAYTNLDTSGVLQFSTICFDVSPHEKFSTLLAGGTLFVIDKEMRTNIPALSRYLEIQQVRTVFLPMSFLKTVFSEEDYIRCFPRCVRHIQTAGEQVVVSERFARYLKENYVYLHNHYGPAETHVVTTYTVDLEKGIPELPPIGKPILNTDIYIVDKYMNLQPVGVPGELYTAGTQVGRGYLDRPGLTAEKFCLRRPGGRFLKKLPPWTPRKNFLLNSSLYPNTPIPHYPIYMTGDLARWLPDGNIDFLGRIDHQVKIRGFRIEPGEIESRLMKHNRVKEVVVTVREDDNRNKFLCAYMVTDGAGTGEIPDITELRQFLSKELPDYMIPSYFVSLEEIPLTPNGKVNRKALPEPDMEIAGMDYTAPRDEVEKKLAAIWADVLGINEDKIRIDGNFFELGGHSLKAALLLSRIHKALDVTVPLGQVFKTPTIRGLAEFIRGAEENLHQSIPPVEKRGYYPVSSAQKRMYLLNRFKRNSDTSDNTPSTAMVEGPLDLQRFEEVLKQLVQRHETLRTSFERIDEEPVQRVHDEVEFKYEYYEYEERRHIRENREQTISAFIRPFDLCRAPLLRVGFLKLAEEKYLLLFDMHHIVSDGTSMVVLMDEFIRLYQGERLPELRVQYRDFTLWQNNLLHSERVKKQEAYWLEVFSGRIPVPDIPTNYPRPAIQGFEGDHIDFELTPELSANLRSLVLESGVTLYMALLAIYTILLSKYTGEEDIVVGTPAAGRPHADLAPLIGMFVNTVAMRNYPHQDLTFKEFLADVKTNTLKAFENQDYQFEGLVHVLGIERDSSRQPLFDTMFAVQNTHRARSLDLFGRKIKDFTFKPYPLEEKITQFDMIIHAWENGNFIAFKWRYCNKLFNRETVETMARHYITIAGEVTADPGIKISDIKMFSSEEELRQLLRDFNNTRGDYPADKTIHQMVEEQAERTPDRVALVGSWQLADGKEENKSAAANITYRELNKKSNQLAHRLRKKGVESGAVVALVMEPSIDMIIGILGILKAGGAYLPIDLEAPGNRISSMLKDSAAALLLTEEGVIENLSYFSLQRFEGSDICPYVSPPRAQVENLDNLQIPDRSLIDYEKYRPYIGQAMVKNSITIHMSRGCVYNCAYCFKIWPKKYVLRSAGNIFEEIRLYYNMGIRRFAFVDDLPNINVEVSSSVFQLIIDHGLKVHLHFPNGIRGDILTKEYIDLMVNAGTITMDLALETTSPRLQKLVRKNLNLKKLEENIRYITETYPHVILELQILHGIPTETEEEARASLEFIKSIKWVHFPYIHVLNIYPQSDMAKIAIENGISREAIERSADLAYHELPETLPFAKSFTREYQAEFLNEYFLSKDRLLTVLPYQVKVLTEDELVQKYNSYLPVDIKDFSQLLDYPGIAREQPGPDAQFLPDDYGEVPGLNQKLEAHFTPRRPGSDFDALRVLLLDLTQYFTSDSKIMYDVVEPPLGLLYLLTHLNRTLGSRVNGRIAKSRIDFDSYGELRQMIQDFKPDIIGIRALNFYKDFFHKTASLIRQWGIDVPIIAGGPYATSNYPSLLKDRNIDLAVVGEGEITFSELVESILDNDGQLPDREILEQIPGLAFVREKDRSYQKQQNQDILLLNRNWELISQEPVENPQPISINRPSSADLVYIIYTSGSTGTPKGVMVQHNNLTNQVTALRRTFNLDASLNYLLLAAPGFDVSVMHIFSPLTTGAKLFLISGEIRKDSRKLWQFIDDHKIDILNIVPAFMKTLLENMEKQKLHFKYLFVGGDAFPGDLYRGLKEAFNAEKIINIYGPTETTINATLYRCNGKETRGILPIGKPLMNYRAYILDNDLNPVPVGVQGELCIAGAGVTRGYLNRPELTAEKFCPWIPPQKLLTKKVTGQRNYMSHMSYTSYIFRTGDLARWLPDGNIEFLGRIDHQVKVRGFRIEPGEIENRLMKHESIKNAVVLAREDENGDKYLCAYIVPADAAIEEKCNTPVTALREYLSRDLPGYMIPAYFVSLEKIPLTTNGKVDKKALPLPGSNVKGSYTAPRNELENMLAAIWGEVLNAGEPQRPIGIDDTFFELGGHSLKATVLISKIHKALNVDVPLVELFRKPTIRGLTQYINETVKDTDTFLSIEPVEEKECYVLSSAQQRLYIIQQMEPRDISYNLPSAVGLEGCIDKDKLESIFRQLIHRHEGLRTSFQTVNEKPVQQIHDEVEFEIEYYNLAPENTEAEEGLHHSSFIIHHFVRAFDLSKAPLLRVGLIKKEEKTHVLMLDIHHAAIDGVSLGMLLKEFMALYAGEDLPAVKLQYKDYSGWQKDEKRKKMVKQQEAYWKGVFEEEIPILNLFYDYPRPGYRYFEGSGLSFEIAPPGASALKKIASDEDATLYMALLSVFIVLLSKFSGQEDIVVGTPVAGRKHADLQGILGMFVNMLALRNYPSGNKTFRDFLREVKQGTLEAFENQDYPFEELVESIRVNRRRDVSRNPLFDVMFSFHNMDIPEVKIPGLTLRPYKLEKTISKFDISLNAREAGNTLIFDLEYSTALFKKETVERFEGYFKKVVSSIRENTEKRILEIEILTEEEKKQLIHEFNNTRKEYPGDKTVHQLLEAQVERTPDKAAACNMGYFSYRELDRQSNRLAGILGTKGVETGDIVAIMADHSVEMLIGVLAVWKLGAAYLPIHSDYPQGRIDYMLNDSGAKILVSELSKESEGTGVVKISELNEQLPTHPTHPTHPAQLCCIIYTSGTTGKPKGVLLTHGNLVNYITWFSRAADVTAADKSLLVSSFAFDLGYTAVYPVLLEGGEIHMVPRETYLSSSDLINYINSRGITYLKMTPSFFSTLLAPGIFDPLKLQKLRLTVLGGEAINVRDVGVLHSRCSHIRVMNHYGPTEATIGCVARFIDFDYFEDYKAVPTIGKPIDNNAVFILDKYLKPVPLGAAGELCVGGSGITRGYLNRPGLTAEKFVDIHHSSFIIHRLYRTGDLARWLPDGHIEFLGRIDHQVKIRGFRVEIGEIENHLLRREDIKEAVVLARESDKGGKYLCAYIVGDPSLRAPALKEYLSKELPDYMVPSYFLFLDRIPLTANRKLDRDALPEPGIAADGDCTAPRDILEEKLVDTWSEILGTGCIGIDDNFFDLGGHSLKAMLMNNRLYKELNLRLPLADVFKHPTIRGLSEHIREVGGISGRSFRAVPSAEKKEYYPLSSAQKGLFVQQHLNPGSTVYNGLQAAAVGGEFQIEAVEAAVVQLIRRHESFRTSFILVDSESTPVQRVHDADNVVFDMEYFDLTTGSTRDFHHSSFSIHHFVQRFVRPFDLSKAPLLRMGLIKLKERKHLLMIDMHHIITDGVSHDIFVREFIAFYQEESPAELHVQYKDYAVWMNSPGKTEDLKKQETFWLKRFEGKIPRLDMPYDYERPEVKGFEGASLLFEIDKELNRGLNRLAVETGTTMYMVLLASYYILLWKYSGQEDIVVGSPITGRNHADLQHIIGMFVNMLAIRNQPHSDKRFYDFLMEVKESVIQSMENQDYHFEELVTAVGLQGGRGRNPLFDVVFAMNNHDFVQVENSKIGNKSGTLKISGYEVDHNTARFDLLIGAFENEEEGGIRMVMEYAAALFKSSTAERFRDHTIAILRQFVEDKNILLKDINLSYGLQAADTSRFREEYEEFEF